VLRNEIDVTEALDVLLVSKLYIAQLYLTVVTYFILAFAIDF